jgi:photosystem II stability/assembly factor-like uncharacterized protein
MILVQADPHHRGTLLAGTARVLLFRSRDNGDTWVPLHFAAELQAMLHAVLIDPARPNVYLVAVSSETPLFAGAFRSVDEGATWEQLRDLRQKQGWSLAFWAADARVITAGAPDDVFLTRNGGENWTSTSSAARAAPRPVVPLAFDPTSYMQAHRTSLGRRSMVGPRGAAFTSAARGLRRFLHRSGSQPT